MAKEPKVLFVSTYPPQQCGIATFTKHLIDSLPADGTAMRAQVAAIVSKGEARAFDGRVVHRIRNAQPGAYTDLAEFVNAGGFDAVCLQHEYGLFSGKWGTDVLTFLDACRTPVVTTLHTVLLQPDAEQLSIMRRLGAGSARLVVLANVGIRLLAKRYGIPREQMSFIPHGVPQTPRADRATLRHRMGMADRRVVLTFGLLSRGKGLEYMVGALPAIRERHPDVLYVVAGQTHPNVRREEGESYRQELRNLARSLGVSSCLRFVDRFLSDADLTEHLQMCDVYVTPYLGQDQISSGTLSYAMAAGCAVVSTPYLYAEELLADDRGRLVEFHDCASLAREVGAILDSPELQQRLMDRAYRFGRSMSWKNVGRQYAALFQEVAGTAALSPRRPPVRPEARRPAAVKLTLPAGRPPTESRSAR